MYAKLFQNKSNIFVKRRVELREAQRASLEPVVIELGSLLYSVVAMSKRLGLAKDDERYKENKERATESARQLDKLKTQVRYTLWGLDDGIHHMVLLPRWAEFTRGDDSITSKLITFATDLRLEIDDEIRRCYLQGRTPAPKAIKRIKAKTKALHEFYIGVKGQDTKNTD